MTVTKLTPKRATEAIRNLAKEKTLKILLTKHAQEQLEKRSAIIPIGIDDVRYLLKNGFIYEPPEESTTKNLWRYKMQGQIPNSERRQLGVIIVPDFEKKSIKVVTVMWIDR